MAEPVVRLTGVAHRYGALHALDGVDLTLPAGRLCGLIGPDGVGKSTLLGLIAGVRRIQQGRVEVLGADLGQRQARMETARRIAYMPQGLGRHLYPSLSVHENLEFFGRLFGQDRRTRAARIAELTRVTGLAPFSDRPVQHLSGGMKQKLGLCCTLIHAPDLLILDEPTTGVDPLARRGFWELLERLRARQPRLSILVSTAYMEEAAHFDILAAMDGGRVLASGTLDALRERTGSGDLEAVFIALLPPARRARHAPLIIPPRPATTAGVPAIQALGLTRCFGQFTAVDQVSLTIQKGEIFGFLGSNGSGKTTTMRMLTGLLPATAGEAWMFGRPITSGDAALRQQLGFMSQSFSLYGELTVRQNLDLHARLYRVDPACIKGRIAELIARFGLGAQLDVRADALPLGMRQRLSLAVAIIHAPALLILDEPTSGVDPLARDRFWAELVALTREQGVTLFISTHFMNEAERCDRLALMHAGRILAQGTPAGLKAEFGTSTLEEAFIAAMKRGGAAEVAPSGAFCEDTNRLIPPHGVANAEADSGGLSLRRCWAYARREGAELARDPIRLAFALLGPLFIMVAMGFGISFDVESIRYAVLDQDRTPASRAYVEEFVGSAWFVEQDPLTDPLDRDRRMASGRLTLAIEIPSGFGRALARGAQPEVSVLIDSAIPFRGQTIQGYVEGVHQRYLESLMPRASETLAPIRILTRFRYNQDFQSVMAMVPGIMTLALIMIPATMTAVGVVREIELGSIVNLYATPTRGAEFLLGKQLPYIGLAFISYLTLLCMALWLFRVPLSGSLGALSVGAFLFVTASTALGLCVSTFMRTQVAAIFGTAILSTISTILFSGMLVPVSALQGPARFMGFGFPSAWFNQVSIGTFTKGLGFADLWFELLVLAAFGLGFWLLGLVLLRTREA